MHIYPGIYYQYVCRLDVQKEVSESSDALTSFHYITHVSCAHMFVFTYQLINFEVCRNSNILLHVVMTYIAIYS